MSKWRLKFLLLLPNTIKSKGLSGNWTQVEGPQTRLAASQPTGAYVKAREINCLMCMRDPGLEFRNFCTSGQWDNHWTAMASKYDYGHRLSLCKLCKYACFQVCVNVYSPVAKILEIKITNIESNISSRIARSVFSPPWPWPSFSRSNFWNYIWFANIS